MGCRHQWSPWVRSATFDQRRLSRCLKGCGATEWRLPTVTEQAADLAAANRHRRDEDIALRTLDEDDDA